MMDTKKLSKKLLQYLLERTSTEHNAFALAILNKLLPQVIPFNGPLGLKIEALTNTRSLVSIPFIRANKNHLGGVHACAMATVGEYTAGILALKHFGAEDYRLILKNISVDYFKQGRQKLWAEVKVESFPEKGDAFDLHLVTHLYQSKPTNATSAEGPVATIKTHWQLKKWSLLRSKS